MEGKKDTGSETLTGKDLDDESTSLEATLLKLPKLLRKRERELEEKEQELEKMCRLLEEKHPCMGEPSDVLRLNVGGTRIDVLRRTLTSVEGSMLAARFSGRWDDSLEKDVDGNFFIDQPIELFLPIINYLRAKAIETPLAPKVKPPKLLQTEECKRMIEYYGMTLGIYPMDLYDLKDNDEKILVDKIQNCDYKLDTQDDWKTYILVSAGHLRMVRSFEIKIGKNTSVSVGWIGSRVNSNRDIVNYRLGGKFVGTTASSVALDCAKNGMVVNDQFTKLNSASMNEGSTIRCEGRGDKWYVNGSLVAQAQQQTGNNDNSNSSIVVGNPGEFYFPLPCVTVKGCVNFVAIELEF